MELHHARHHQTYVTGLNTALEKIAAVCPCSARVFICLYQFLQLPASNFRKAVCGTCDAEMVACSCFCEEQTSLDALQLLQHMQQTLCRCLTQYQQNQICLAEVY